MKTQEDLVKGIQDKYESRGQNPNTYMEGLLHSRPINYWEYCQIETLLTLQSPRTEIPDEGVFIMYHQVNELLFKMVLWEVKQIAERVGKLDVNYFISKLGRIKRYFDVLTNSYDIMTEGMEVSQYMEFRTALTPASGFQSAQYRMLELAFTDMDNLVDLRFRSKLTPETTRKEKYELLYWQAAMRNPITGGKGDTLVHFEEKYKHKLIGFSKEYVDSNMLKCYESLSSEDKKNPELIKALRELDFTINIKWVLAHLRTAEKYLQSSGKPVAATGGSPWKKYMHPMYQKRIFFPSLWTEQEKADWGKDVE